MGTPDFAVQSLEILLNNKYTISAVVTAPDKPRGRGQQVSFTPVKKFALQYALPVLQPESLKDSTFITQLQLLQPDLFVIVAFRILPKEVFTIPKLGAFNLHASLLPKYRGAAPINWAIINGETESGVTSFLLREKVDTGNIILQAHVAIREEMTAGDLHDVLAEVGAEIVLQTVRLIEIGKAVPRTQDDSIATPAPKLFKENTKIDWNRSTSEVHNFIRGLSPHPAAWTTHKGKLMKIFRSQKSGIGVQKLQCGEVSIADRKIFVGTSDGAIEILEIQQEGKKRIAAEEFLRGFTFEANDLFE